MKKVGKYYKVFVIVLLFLILIVSVLDLYSSNRKEKKMNSKINNIYDIQVGANDNFVFLGDSITEQYNLEEFYEKLPTVNSGIGGNKTDDILSDMENRVYKYNPTKVILLIGTNDIIDHKEVDEVFNNINKIIKNIEENRALTKIYVESVYPSRIDYKDEDYKDKVNELNKKIEKKYKDTDVVYIDINSHLKDDDGQLKKEYTADGLHLNTKGYIKVTKLLLPYLNE